MNVSLLEFLLFVSFHTHAVEFNNRWASKARVTLDSQAVHAQQVGVDNDERKKGRILDELDVNFALLQNWYQ